MNTPVSSENLWFMVLLRQLICEAKDQMEVKRGSALNFKVVMTPCQRLESEVEEDVRF